MTNRNKIQKGFVKIDRLIKQNAKEKKIDEALYRYKTLKSWQKIAGSFVEEAARLTQAVDFKKGVLVVASLSREAAFKLRLFVDKIIQALNELMGVKVVFAIRFEV